MAVHKIFRGDRTRCAQLYPMARQKLGILRKVLLSSGQTSVVQRFDLTTDEIIMIYVNGTEEYIYITAGGDGYYCLGDLGGSTDHISASATALGAFAPRGTYDGDSFDIPGLAYVGRGKGVLPDIDTQDGITRTTFRETRQGLTFKDAIEFAHATDIRGSFWYLVSSARASVGDIVERSYGTTYKFYDGAGEAYGAYLYTLDGAENWALKQTGFGGGIEVGVPKIVRVGPRDLWGPVPAFLGDNNNDSQLSYLLLSDDNAQSLGVASGGDYIGDIFKPAGYTDAQFNAELAAAINGTLAVRLHNTDRDLLITVQSRIHADTTVTPRIYRAPIDTGTPIFVMELASIPGNHTTTVGVVLLVNQDVPVLVAAPDDPAESKSMFVGDGDGASWTRRSLPWPAHSTGTPAAFNRDTVVCTAHNPENGHYELYQTEDLGQSWQYRATVRTDAPPPDENTATLLRFGRLSILRQRGRPANSFPGQPWVGDNRITPPGA